MRRLALVLLAASAVGVAVAPLLMPESYSALEHSVSESAAQGVEGAWLARSAFLLLGFAVLVLDQAVGERWGLWGRIAHRIYGVAMIAVAAYSHMPWQDVPYDAFEDTLHSVAAGAVGFGFTAGVVAVGIRRGRNPGPIRVLDSIAVLAAVILPMVLFNADGLGGLAQRVLFGIGYAWYATEAITRPAAGGDAKAGHPPGAPPGPAAPPPAPNGPRA